MLAAFVQAVNLEQPLAQVPDGHLGDVFLDHRLELGEGHFGQHAPAAFDHAGDGEGVPEALPQTLQEQQLPLGVTGVADASEQG